MSQEERGVKGRQQQGEGEQDKESHLNTSSNSRATMQPAGAATAKQKTSQQEDEEVFDADEEGGTAVGRAIERANNESQTKDGRATANMQQGEQRSEDSTAAPKQITPRGRQPLANLAKMNKQELIEYLQDLEERISKGGFGQTINKAIRWNNGEEPNVQNGEVVSPRDSGSISVYGFARRPLTLYAGQWVQLAHYLPAILEFIEEHQDDINQYVEQRLGNGSKAVTSDEVKNAQALFCAE